MRGAASLGYLLARTSDTLADSGAIPMGDRVEWLSRFESAVSGREELGRWPGGMLDAVTDPDERRLLESVADPGAWLERLPEEEACLVREVVGIIIGGQRWDLERFAAADGGRPVSLADDAELEEYAWRVAGCVGEFWTKLGYLTMGERFSRVASGVLLDLGSCYGKGLQLVNILRDVPVDLANGRCYLPVADPGDTEALMDAHGRWLEKASGWMGAGFSYGGALSSGRLRAATVLPAMIARETLERMRGADWAALQARVKVPRWWVYLAVLRAFGAGAG